MTLQCYSQSITWQRTYDSPFHFNDAGYGLSNADNGNFYIVGSMEDSSADNIYVLKINASGDTLWTRRYGDGFHGGEQGLCATTAGDFGCVISGYWDSSFTMKVNTNGDLSWLNFYGGGNRQIYDIQTTVDGGFVGCGREVGININGFVFKVNATGNIEWQKSYSSSFSKVYNAVVPSIAGNGFFLCGSLNNTPTDSTRGIIAHINNNGEIVWEDTIRVVGLSACLSISMQGNVIVIGGRTDLNFWKTFIVKTDTSGIVYRQILINANKKEYFNRLSIVNPNKYVIAAGRDSLNGLITNGKVFTTDSNGTILNDRVYLTANYILMKRVLPLNNGDFLFAGTSRFDYNHYADVYALRTDFLLNAPPPIGILNNSYQVPVAAFISNNFPNPFNPSTQFYLIVNRKAHFKIKVYDMLGKMIADLCNKQLDAGTYNFRFDALGQPSAVYFLALYEDNTMIQTNKMILIH